MTIALMIVCEWHGQSKRETPISSPSWALVEKAIARLNNDTFNDVYLYPDKNDLCTFLGIGGGTGRYLVTGSVQNEYFPTAIDPTKRSAAKESVVIGGQAGEYPENWILDLPTALRAVRAYYDLGVHGGDVTWINS